MADNTILSTAVGTGDTIRDLAESGGVKWPVAVACYATTISAGNNVLQIVDATHGLPIAVVGTVPVSAASLPLPSGASTSAKQPAIGTAGTASADVLTIQGIASMTKLLVTPDANSSVNLNQIAGTAVDSNSGNKSGGTLRVVIATDQPSLSNALTVSMSATTNAGATAKTSDYDTGGGTDTVTMFGIALPASGGAVQGGTATNPIRTDPTGSTTQPVSGTVTVTQTTGTSLHSVIDSGTITTVSTLTSLSQWAGNAIDTNSGVKSGGTLRVVLATDQPALTNKLLVTPDANSAVNVAQINGVTVTMGNGVSGTGVQRVTIASDSTGTVAATQSGTWTVQPGNTPNSTPWLVTLSPATSGGWTPARVKAASGTNATNVKNAAGQIGGWALYNNAASMRAVHVYNSSSAPTAGSGTPAFTILLPANGGANVDFETGIAMSSGIGYTITTGASDSDTGSCSAEDVHGVLLYK